MTLSVFDMSERLQDLRLGGTTNTSVVHDVGGESIAAVACVTHIVAIGLGTS